MWGVYVYTHYKVTLHSGFTIARYIRRFYFSLFSLFLSFTLSLSLSLCRQHRTKN